MGAPDRSIRFVFDTVAGAYASGRPDMPLDAVRRAAEALGLPPAARVLEVGAGCGQLTWALAEAGFDVVSLEPGAKLRSRAQARVPRAEFHAETFEEFEPAGRFDALFSSNAFHWVDPEVRYDRAADVADGLALIWNTPFLADPDLRRRVQGGVMIPQGSTFPTEEEDIRRLVADELAGEIGRIRASRRFEEPWSCVLERQLEYTSGRYRDLIGSMGHVASGGRRDAILAELEPILGEEPLEVIDLVWVIGARAA